MASSKEIDVKAGKSGRATWNSSLTFIRHFIPIYAPADSFVERGVVRGAKRAVANDGPCLPRLRESTPPRRAPCKVASTEEGLSKIISRFVRADLSLARAAAV